DVKFASKVVRSLSFVRPGVQRAWGTFLIMAAFLGLLFGAPEVWARLLATIAICAYAAWQFREGAPDRGRARLGRETPEYAIGKHGRSRHFVARQDLKAIACPYRRRDRANGTDRPPQFGPDRVRLDLLVEPLEIC
ncbi:MAG TPA: hypothetical protein VGK66_05330, partial [Solirubrobacterales bacterium]